MKIDCAIVDDEPYAIQLLARHISKIQDFNLVLESSQPLEALQEIKTHQVDLVFLDINMPGLNGIELSALLQQNQKVIFTTAYSEHAVASYEQNALDYLLKPITFDRFLLSVSRVSEYFELRQKNKDEQMTFFFIKSGRSIVRIEVNKILVIEGQKDYALISTSDGDYTCLKTLKSFEYELPDHFLRVHHSFIINTRHIKRFEHNHVSVGIKRAPVSSK